MLVLVLSYYNDNLKEIMNSIAESIDVKSFYISINDRKTNVALGKKYIHISGGKIIKESIEGINFNISPDSFFQVNLEQAKKLYSKAISFLGEIEEKTIIDAYSGTGTIAMILAKKAKSVYAIENIRSASNDGEKTAKENNIKNIKFINAKVEESIDKLMKQNKIDAIVFDPPRKGIEGNILEQVAKIGIKEIVYISCNPSTFARDLKILKGFGYKLEKIQAIDMFPQTSHIELVAKIIKENTEG